MLIVSQFAPFSHSPFPLLPAPTPRLLLAAPKIAGFLPARVPIVFTDEILMRDDPTPAPFVSKYREKMPPGLLELIGHLPTPDEYMEAITRDLDSIYADFDNAHNAYRAWRERTRS
jgi:hypothetical protein